MMGRINRILISITLVLCLLLSACGGIATPDDLDEFIGEEQETPTATAVPNQDEESKLEDSAEFGVVQLSETEDLLLSYYGISFADDQIYQASFYQTTRSYDFAEIPIGVSCDSSYAIPNGKVSIVASVSAYNHLGNVLSKGITSNMTSNVRAETFSSDDYIHGIAITYPGTYYVKYTITVKDSAEELLSQEYEAQTLTYVVEKTYVIEKVDAYIYSESDFYFVSEGGADVRDDAEIYITTSEGWDITEICEQDIYDTSKITLNVEKMTVETDMAGEYELVISATKNDVEMEYIDIVSKYFNIEIQNGYRYIIPAQDAVGVVAVYDTLSSLLVDYYMDEYDFAKFDSYMAVLKDYQGLSDTQKLLFDFYPYYLLKYDKDFSYNDYYAMRSAHDWTLRFEIDSERVEYGETLAKMILSYESGDCEIAEIATYLVGLSSESVCIDESLDSSNMIYYSDLEFAVLYAFGGNAENGYVDLEIDEWGDSSFAESQSLVNVEINSRLLEFEMYESAVDVFVAILKGENSTVLSSGINFISAYESFLAVSDGDEYSLLIFETIGEFITFEYDSKYECYNATQTESLSCGDVLSSDVLFGIKILRECVFESYQNLLGVQKSHAVAGEYATAYSACCNMILRFEAYLDVVECFQSDLQNGSVTLENGGVLIFDTQSEIGNIAGDNNIANVMFGCSILNVESVVSALTE
ncbi:MAG: hypothetical protein R3Y32_07715 [Bacillota bacterium]